MPYCGAAETGDPGRARGRPDVRYVWRHLPLTDVHPQAQLAAEAAEAAGGAGRVLADARPAADPQEKLSGVDLMRYARDQGLDAADSMRT